VLGCFLTSAAGSATFLCSIETSIRASAISGS
jgi:hypothetical protein